MDDARPRRGLATARAVLQVLAYLEEHPEGVRADEVAHVVGKSGSTAYYLLASLVEEGFATHDGGLYRPRAPRPQPRRRGRRPPRARGRRRRPVPAHPQALLPRRRAPGRDRDHRRARPPGHRRACPGLGHAHHRQRPRAGDGQGRARAAAARGGRRATPRAGCPRYTRATITDVRGARARARAGAPARLRGRPRGVRRGLLLRRRARDRRARRAARRSSACRRRRGRSTPSTTSWPTAVSASPPRAALARPSHEPPFQHRAEKHGFLDGARDRSYGPAEHRRKLGAERRAPRFHDGGRDRESGEHHEGPQQDPGALLGSHVRLAGGEVRHRLHVREGAEEGPAQAGPAVLLPDGGGEGQPRLRRDGRRDPRQHVPPGPGALDGVAEAVPLHHPVPRDLRRARHAADDRLRAEPVDPQRPGHPDDRRGPPLDDPDEPQAAVHEPLRRSRPGSTSPRRGSRTATPARSAASSARASSPATRSPPRTST